jgi:hypothetical protein
MTIDFAALAAQVLPTALKVGGQLLASSDAQEQNSQAASNYNAGLGDAANTLNQGYLDQLDQIEQGIDTVGDINLTALDQVAQQYQSAGDQYGRALGENIGDYAGYIYPQYNKYVDQMLDTEGNVADLVNYYSGEVSNLYDPYVETGTEALGELRSIAFSDPSELTPSQMLMKEKAGDELSAYLAASGLRGAGNAQVAAYKKIMSDLDAQFYDQNQSRMDKALQALSNAGITFTGKQVANTDSTGRTLSNLRNTYGGNIA